MQALNSTVKSSATVSGRPVFAVVAVLAILVAGAFGAVVGASGQEQATTLDVLGVASFPMTPISMAAFGMAATAGALALLFGLVTVASRYDETADRRQ